MKNKKRLIFTTSLYLLIVLTVTTTFAWFFINREIEIDYTSEIICQAGTSLEISMLNGIDEETQEEDWSQYSSYIKYTGVNAKIEDISGDGKNLYRPTAITNDPETGELIPEGLAPAVKTDEDGYGEFLEVEVKLRTTSTMNVYLSGASEILPINTSDTDKNVFGDFPKDYIAGAIRVAILEKDENGNEELKMIWAPNPYIHLKKEGNSYSCKDGGEIETYYYYKIDSNTGKMVKYQVTSDEYASKLFVLGNTETTELMTGKSPVITNLSPSLDSIYEQRIVIRVWFEGTDREANQALSGGKVRMNLKFIGMQEKLDASDTNVALVESVSFTEVDGKVTEVVNMTSDMYYSFDGYTWEQYDESKQDSIISNINGRTENLIMYIKYPENEVSYEYMIRHEFIKEVTNE